MKYLNIILLVCIIFFYSCSLEETSPKVQVSNASEDILGFFSGTIINYTPEGKTTDSSSTSFEIYKDESTNQFIISNEGDDFIITRDSTYTDVYVFSISNYSIDINEMSNTQILLKGKGIFPLDSEDLGKYHGYFNLVDQEFTLWIDVYLNNILRGEIKLSGKKI